MMTKPPSVIAGGTHASGLTANSLVVRYSLPCRIPRLRLTALFVRKCSDHSRRCVHRTDLIHAPRVALPTVQPKPRSPPPPPIRQQRVRLDGLRVPWRGRHCAAPLHLIKRALAVSGQRRAVRARGPTCPQAAGRHRDQGAGNDAYAMGREGGRHAPAVLLWRCDAARVAGAYACTLTTKLYWHTHFLPRQVPTQPASNTKHANGALGIAHLRLLAPPNVFTTLSADLTAIMGEAPVENSAREHVWLLDLPGNIAPKWHPRLVLCEPDMNDEGQARFVRTHGAGLFELGVRIAESGGKQGSSETPFGRVAWIPV